MGVRGMSDEKPKRDPSYCDCKTPVLDSDVGEADGDDDWCWRCRRPLEGTD